MELSGDDEDVKVSGFPELPGVELWVARRTTRRWRRYHGWYATWALAEQPRFAGRFVWRWRRSSWPAGPTSTMLLEPDEVQVADEVSAPASFHMLQLSPEFVAEALGRGDRAAQPQVRAARLDDDGVYGRFQRLCARLQDPGCDPLEREATLRRYVREVFERAPERAPTERAVGPERAVRRARDYIEANHALRLSLDEVAAAAGLSKFHLERSFGASMGLPVWEFVKQVRVRRAMEMLRQGRRPADVAPLVGFSDQAHLTRVFREELGLTPGQYRKAHGT